MITLCMDSSYQYLTILVLKDQEILASNSFFCWKKQSEMFFPTLVEVLEAANISTNDINEVCISNGPGSYTGIRIAMSIAKVFCTQKHIPLKVVSSLLLYAGIDPNALVAIDARSNRYYVGSYQAKKALFKPYIASKDELEILVKNHQGTFYCDQELFNHQPLVVDFVNNFVHILDKAELVDAHNCNPVYLKGNEAYKNG